MAPFRKDITEIQTKLKDVIGKKAWGVKHGIGTFVTMNFGHPLPPEGPNETSFGEWHLWVYGEGSYATESCI